jgi:hypothetical protein
MCLTLTFFLAFYIEQSTNLHLLCGKQTTSLDDNYPENYAIISLCFLYTNEPFFEH